MATLVIAHRGASAEKPENTLAAFRRALALGVDGIELDVQVTRDGVPVVFHDATLRRLTGRPGRVTAKTWPELQKLRVDGTEPIPCLAEVLALTRGRAMVQIELKRGATVAPVVAVIKKARAGKRVVLASFEPALVQASARFAPAVPRMLISDGQQAPAMLARQITAARAGGLSVDHRVIRSADFVRYFHGRGFAVWCWTVNDSRMARRLASWGIDGLIGDNPALLKRVI